MLVATDVCGTLTDMVAFDEELPGSPAAVGAAGIGSIPPNFAAGALNAIRMTGVNGPGFDRFVHGTHAVTPPAWLSHVSIHGSLRVTLINEGHGVMMGAA